MCRFLPSPWRPRLCACSVLFSPRERPWRRLKKLRTYFSYSNQVSLFVWWVPKYSRLFRHNLVFASSLEAFNSASVRDWPRTASLSGWGATGVFCDFSISPSINATFPDRGSKYLSEADCLSLIVFNSYDMMNLPSSILCTVSRICYIWDAPVAVPGLVLILLRQQKL